MRKIMVLGGIASTLLGASVVMAASPAPSATPAPAATPAPTVPPKATGGASSAAASGWSAAVQPLALSGTATVVKGADGTATLTLALQGIAPDQELTVTAYRGVAGRFENRAAIFRATRSDIEQLGADTVRLHLTKAEFAALDAARTSSGILVVVSDGTREAIATFAKG